MKTKINFIAILSVLFTFSVAIAQEGIESTNNDYVQQRTLDLQQQENPIQEQGVSSTSSTRIQAAAELINYQAVARDASGNLMTNAAVSIDFYIRDSSGGTAVFNETQNLTTDANGVFSAQIGSVNSLIDINWSGIEPWLQVSLNGTNVGETQMASVPTALHSKQSGKVLIYGSGTSNADKMIASHSPAYPGWGIGYNDGSDAIDFMSGGVSTANVNLGSGNITTQGNIAISSTTSSPSANTIYGNSVPVAYGSISPVGIIRTGYGITSVNNVATGVYEIIIDNSLLDNTYLSASVTAYSPGSPVICTYGTSTQDSFSIYCWGGVSGNPVNSEFTFVVWAGTN